jgi:chemotaxis protein MotB
MRKRRSLLSDYDGTKDIWPSFTDVMTTMALILFVLVLLAFVKTLISGKQLAAFQLRISESAQKLRALEDELRRTSIEIETGKSQLQASEQKLLEQQQILSDNSRELGGLRSRLQGIALLRVDVLDKVKKSIEAELRSTSKPNAEVVTIGDNGNIIINERLVFEYNSYTIKSDAKPLLDTLAKALGNLLADATVRENIDAVVIQGHTDERGSASFNRDLSAKRANAVLDYLFEANRTLEQEYGSYFASSAYSKFRPLNPAKTEAAYEQNRRIEMSVVLKDANVRNVIDDYMRSLNPALPAAPP